MAYGTLTLADLQRTQLNTTVATIGLDTTFEALANTLAIHNEQTREMFSDFAERTTDQMRRYGGNDTMDMEAGDETSVPRAQKVTAGANVGFPLDKWDGGLQWTGMWFRKRTIAELAAQVNAMMDADQRRLQNELRRAIYTPTNNLTYTDRLVNNLTLPVKRLANADGDPLPAGPNAESFDGSTHTHYLARVSTLAASDLDALINTVREHVAEAELRVYLNQSDEAAVRAFTGFVAYIDPRLIGPTTATEPAAGRGLDVVNINNRAIGLYNGAEVWVKPWVLASCPIAWNAMGQKPVCYRYDPDYGDGLQLINPSSGEPYAENNILDPYNVRVYRRTFGLGVWNRIAAAVSYWGGTSYTAPTIS